MAPSFIHPRRALLAAALLAWSSLPAMDAWADLQGVPPTPAAAPPAPEAPPAAPAPVQWSIAPQVAQASKERLARILGLFSGKAIRRDEVAVADIELATILAEQAVEMSPDDPGAWRALLDATSLGDPTDPRVDQLRRSAVEQLVRLDPSDEVMRLRRLLDVLDRETTADGRIAKLETLLDPAHRETLGNSVAARLALDLAILYRRTGDLESFEKWLAEAATLDPAFPDAQAMAAGYFRFKAGDITKEAELLLASMMANPLDPMATRGFATILLDHGAYDSAARFLGLAAGIIKSDYPILDYDLLLADQAIALWASGRGDQGAELARGRQIKLAQFVRNRLAKEDPSVLADTERMKAIRFPVPSPLLAAQAAILRSQGDVNATKKAIDDLLFSLENEVEVAKEEAEKATDEAAKADGMEEQAATLLQGAFVLLWLGEDTAKAKEWMAKAEAIRPLSEEAKQRFEAWLALRSAEPASAVALFEALTEDSQPVHVGRALAYFAVDRKRDAAKELLVAARLAPGTLLGVDARVRLAGLLGQPVPAEPDAAALDTLANGVPHEFDRMLTGDSRLISMRIRTSGQPRDVYEPIPISIEVTNSSPFPLAVGEAGPIRDLVTLQGSVSAVGRQPIDVPYSIQSIGRTFVLQPRSTLAVPIDLAYTEVGLVTRPFPASGCSIVVRGILNWEPTVGAFKPGALGDRADSDIIRIDGVRFSADWLDATYDSLRAGVTPDNLVHLMAIAHAASRVAAAKQTIDPAWQTRFDQVWTVLADLMPHLDRWTQGWLLCALPDNIPPLEPTLDTVRGSSDKLVRLSYLIRRATQSVDPMVDSAIRSDDPEISRYGRIVKEMLLHEEEITKRDFNLGTSGAGQLQKPLAGGATPPGGEPGTPPSAPPPTQPPAPPPALPSAKP